MVVVAETPQNLSAVNGFYVAEAYTLSTQCGSSNTPARFDVTPQLIPATFATIAAGGKIRGIVLPIIPGANTHSYIAQDRSVTCELQQILTPITISIANPCVVSYTSHSLTNGTAVVINTTGALPTGLTKDTVIYYTFSTGANTFNLYDTYANAIAGGVTGRIITTGTQSGVHTMGVTRASATKTKTEIYGTDTYIAGTYMIPFLFTPYTVDTTVGKWRFRVSAGTGSYAVSLTRNLANTDISFCAWGDTVASFNDNDCLICAAKVTIDKSAIFKGVTGDTSYNYSGWVCTSPTITEDGIYMLEWENTPAASYTVQWDSPMQVASHSGFRCGTATNKIPLSKQAIMVVKAASALSAGAFVPAGNTGWYTNNKQALSLNGEVAPFTTLASDAANGQKNIVTTDAMSWSIGDTIFMGKEQRAVGSFCDTVTQFKIASISGTSITLDTNITNCPRKAGGTVARFGGNGIKITAGTATTYTGSAVFWLMAGSQKFSVNGCSISGIYMSVGAGYPANDAVLTKELNATNNTLYWLASNSGYTFFNISSSVTGWIANSGVTFTPINYTDNISFAGGANLNTGDVCSILRNRTVNINQYNAVVKAIMNTPNCTEIISDNRVESGYVTAAVHTLSGTNPTWTNNYYYRINDYLGLPCCILFQNVYNAVGTQMTGNTFEDVERIYQFDTSPVLNTFIKGNTITGSTTDLVLGANFNQTIFDTPLKSTDFVVDSANQTLMTAGSRIGITNNGTTTNNDISYLKYGNIKRCGASLTDTTVHTVGGYSMRFESLSSALRLQLDSVVALPSSLNGETRDFGIWCLINKEAYWAGTNQLPRLTVTIGGVVYGYVQASAIAGDTAGVANNGWQYLTIPVTFTGNPGDITFSLSTMTGALTSNAYVYFDDWSGGNLVNTSMDAWSNALPVAPAYSFLQTSKDMWSASTSTNWGTNTIGEKVKSLKNPSLIIDGEIII